MVHIQAQAIKLKLLNSTLSLQSLAKLASPFVLLLLELLPRSLPGFSAEPNQIWLSIEYLNQPLLSSTFSF
jgi:hypothetical protein